VFSESARRLAGIAGAWLGWRPDEFWNATPAELATVIEALDGGASVACASRDDLERLKRMFPDG
jgi:uncharacterized phage protein (TIGR02216 family)